MYQDSAARSAVAGKAESDARQSGVPSSRGVGVVGASGVAGSASKRVRTSKVPDSLPASLSSKPSSSNSPVAKCQTKRSQDVGTLTEVCSSSDLAEVELVSLLEEQLPNYRLRADYLTEFQGYQHQDWTVPFPALSPDTCVSSLSPAVIKETLDYFVLCGQRVSQMTRVYHDIQAVTNLLEEKEKDLELAAQIGQQLLGRNRALEEKVGSLENELMTANETVVQLKHQVHIKSNLLELYTMSEGDTDLEFAGAGHSGGLKQPEFLLQQKVKTLEEENTSLKVEAHELLTQTSSIEAHEKELMAEISKQLCDSNTQIRCVSEELATRVEENIQLQEEITSLLAQLVNCQSKNRSLQNEVDDLSYMLDSAKETQNDLTTELADLKDKYSEILELLHDTQEQVRRYERNSHGASRPWDTPLPWAMESYASPFTDEVCAASLAAEIEESLAAEVHEECQQKMSNAIQKVFSTYKAANKSRPRLFSGGDQSVYGSPPRIGGSGMNAMLENLRLPTFVSPVKMSASGADTTYLCSGLPRGGTIPSLGCDSAWHSDTDVLSADETVATDDIYAATSSVGVPGYPGSKDLKTALQKLNPAAIYEHRKLFSDSGEDDGFLSDADTGMGQSMCSSQLGGLSSLGASSNRSNPYYHINARRTPDSLMSTGQNQPHSVTYRPWRMPEKLQLVKPMKGSVMLHNWAQMAVPHMGRVLETEPGVAHKANVFQHPVVTVTSSQPVTTSAPTTLSSSCGLAGLLGDAALSLYSSIASTQPMSTSKPIMVTSTPIPTASSASTGSGPVVWGSFGKGFEPTHGTYKYVYSNIMNLDNTNVTPCLHGAQMTVVDIGTPLVTPAGSRSHSRRPSTCTFSTNLGIARVLNERGFENEQRSRPGSMRPSACCSPQGTPPRISSPSMLTTPCNSPDEEEPFSERKQSSGVHDDLWEGLVSLSRKGAAFFRRTLGGEDPSRDAQRDARRTGSLRRSKKDKNRTRTRSKVDPTDILAARQATQAKSRSELNAGQLSGILSRGTLMSIHLLPSIGGPLYARPSMMSPMAQLMSSSPLAALKSSVLSTSPKSGATSSRFAEADAVEEEKEKETKTKFSVAKKPPSLFGIPVQPKPGVLAGKVSLLGANVRPDLGKVGIKRHPPPPPSANQKEEEMGALSFLSFGRKGGLF